MSLLFSKWVKRLMVDKSSMLLRDTELAAKGVNVEVNKAGLVDILGGAGEVNVQVEDVKKLPVCA
jgi:fructose-1,6-bisphosphatase I